MRSIRRLVLWALFVVAVATGTNAHATTSARAPKELTGARILLDPEVRLRRAPSIPSQQGVIVERYLRSLREALTAAGLVVVDEVSQPHDFKISASAEKAHTDGHVKELLLTVRRGRDAITTLSWLRMRPGSEWATDAASQLVTSTAMVEAGRKLQIEREAAAPAARAPEALSEATLAAARGRGAIAAVLPLSVLSGDVEPAARTTYEEALRTVAADGLSPVGYTVLSGENTLRVLADNNVDTTKVCEASCALEAARELKATLFFSSSLAQTEGRFVSFVRLFEAKSGRQLASLQLDGATVRELRAQLNTEVSPFLAKGLAQYARLRTE
jgi:hypothetical protein